MLIETFSPILKHHAIFTTMVHKKRAIFNLPKMVSESLDTFYSENSNIQWDFLSIWIFNLQLG